MASYLPLVQRIQVVGSSHLACHQRATRANTYTKTNTFPHMSHYTHPWTMVGKFLPHRHCHCQDDRVIYFSPLLKIGQNSYTFYAGIHRSCLDQPHNTHPPVTIINLTQLTQHLHQLHAQRWHHQSITGYFDLFETSMESTSSLH
jgi:hypothetical protein